MRIFSLEGKTAFIAGASRGIGLAIARMMAEAGARVTLAARSERELEMRAAEIGGTAVRLDLRDPQSIATAVEAAGTPDILVNVAGMNIRRRFEDYPEEDIRTIMDSNLNGIVRLTQLVGARMIARGRGGKVLSIGSLWSTMAVPYVAVYAMTKGALAQLTKALAVEWAPHNIQVNCIAPGFIVTDLNRRMWEDPAMWGWLQGVQANPKPGKPEDVASLAVFLAGAGADYITGQVIAVDGGYTTTARWPFEPS
ncbi:MAG TPA: SDR family oxidoreductase [Bryobacteraceae bacterium]|nr:SDR family oxidoreductase [Bryobacteraceae bacterium]